MPAARPRTRSRLVLQRNTWFEPIDQLIDRAPRYHVKTTDWGAMYAAYRPARPGHLYYRFAHFAFPAVGRLAQTVKPFFGLLLGTEKVE